MERKSKKKLTLLPTPEDETFLFAPVLLNSHLFFSVFANGGISYKFFRHQSFPHKSFFFLPSLSSKQQKNRCICERFNNMFFLIGKTRQTQTPTPNLFLLRVPIHQPILS
jgi:hypothetical protein